MEKNSTAKIKGSIKPFRIKNRLDMDTKLRQKWFPLNEITVRKVLVSFVLAICLVSTAKAKQEVATIQKAPVIHLDTEEISVRQMVDQVESQTDYRFSFDWNQIDTELTFRVNSEELKIKSLLSEMVAQTGLSYQILKRNIHIRKNQKPKPKKQPEARQEKIQGTVTDAQTGDTLPGVNILVKGTSTGSSTDQNGNFELTAESLQDTLVVSFIGYQTQEVPINGRTEVNVDLKPQAITGEELVVVGYGEQKKENLTGSISQVSSKDVEMRAVNSSIEALRGLAPNLKISLNASGAEADASRNINIRGTGSLSGSNPYILIDGVRSTQGELSALNPADIKSTSVLKDAAASAIYGAHAAFGVILVKTKEGNKNRGFTINYSNNVRLKKRIFVPPSVNSLEFAKLANTASKNFSGQTTFTEEQMANIRSFIEGGDKKYGTAPDPDNPTLWLGIETGNSNGWYSGYANTDWYDVMYKNIEATQKHNISVRGGSDDIAYYLSGGFLKDSGQLKYGDSNEYYNRYNLNSNITADVTDWLQVSNITRLSNEENSFPASRNREIRGRFYHDIMRWAPTAPYKTPPVKDNQGNVIVPEQTAHIAGRTDKNGFNKYSINNLVSTLKAKANISENFSVSGDFTFKRRLYNKTVNLKKWALLGPDGSTSVSYQANNNQIRKDYRKTNYKSFNIYGDYEKTFWEDNNFHVLVGYQQEENDFSRLEAARNNVIASNLNSINVATGNIIGPNNPISTYSTLGVFGRLQYNYKQKYLFEFNGRYDGSSKFAVGDRFVFSPSLSAGYNIHKEDFWNPISKYINRFKIRGSWGKLGNQEVGSYLYVSQIPVRTRLPWVIGGERPNYTNMPNIVSPNITWETSLTKNIGVDIAFLNNRLSASVDIYERDTDNMFGPSKALPAVLGTSPPRSNSASLRTRGWELTVGWQDQINRDFSYNITLMASDNQTTITDYNNPNKVLGDFYEGQKLGEIWGYEADKLFQSQEEVDNYLSEVDLSFMGTAWQPGNVKYKDLNGDGKVNIGDNTANNAGDRRVIGNSRPRYEFSIQTGASWKNFDLNMLWQGVGKWDYMPNGYNTLFWGWNRKAHSHITKAVMDYWSKDNRDAYLPIPLDANGRAGFSKDRRPSTRYLQDGVYYVRLKSLKLSYTLPSFLTDKVGIKNVRAFVNGENLFTITDMWPNLDPELARPAGILQGNGRAYPLAKTYGFGVDISF